jgi:hypothetical protein
MQKRFLQTVSRQSFPTAAGLGALLLCVLLLGSCMGFGEAEMGMAYPEDEEAPRLSKASAPAAGALDVQAPPLREAEPALAPPAAPEHPERRLRVYAGFCRLMVEDPNKEKEKIAAVAEEAGGYVESSTTQTVVIRVPAESFRAIFEQILSAGRVLEKAVESSDVTDLFRDNQARLDIARKTRTRLYALLEESEDVEERLKILREIRRLSEEIERLERFLELLQRQIALSRITVQLVPRLTPEEAAAADIPFPWIAALDPLYASLRRLGPKIEFGPGEEFAVFDREAYYRAESAEGTRVRIGSRSNWPAGDAEFWQKALAHHLGPYYRSAAPLTLGPVRAVLFSSKDREPYSYLVGVLTTPKEARTLVVVEIFFPDAAALKLRLEALKAALSRLEVK